MVLSGGELRIDTQRQEQKCEVIGCTEKASRNVSGVIGGRRLRMDPPKKVEK